MTVKCLCIVFTGVTVPVICLSHFKFLVFYIGYTLVARIKSIQILICVYKVEGEGDTRVAQGTQYKC